MADAFSPDGVIWHPISPRWIGLKRISMIIGWSVLTALAAVPSFLFLPWWVGAAAVAVGLATLLFRLTRAPKLWRSWGYAERDDDLYVRHGLMWRELTAVPYGRMQLVEVTSGPIERAFHLATVTMKTASASTSARVPGLEAAEAATLREHLTALGEARSAGM